MPSDPIQAMEFAQSKGQAHKEGRTNVTLKDVAGLDATVGRLQQVVTYLKDPAGTQFRGLARPPKGILLEGDPGVGKTLIAKAIAGEAGVPFFQVCQPIEHRSGRLSCAFNLASRQKACTKRKLKFAGSGCKHTDRACDAAHE